MRTILAYDGGALAGDRTSISFWTLMEEFCSLLSKSLKSGFPSSYTGPMKYYRLIGVAVLLALASALVLGQEMQVRGTLISDHVKSETALWVDVQNEFKIGKEVVLVSSVGELRETYTIKKIVESMVILEERLRNNYPAGTRLLQ